MQIHFSFFHSLQTVVSNKKIWVLIILPFKIIHFLIKKNILILIGDDHDELDKLSEDENIKILDICIGLLFET